MKIPNFLVLIGRNPLSLARIVSEDSQLRRLHWDSFSKSSKDS